MAGSLDFLFSGTPPPSVTGNIASITGLPDWYQEYMRGMAGQATSLAGDQAQEAIPAQSVAGFTPDQTAAFGDVRANQGVWQPYLADQSGALASVQPAVKSAVGAATGAVSGPAGAAAGTTAPFLSSAMGDVSGPAAKWTDHFKEYMSPYTSQVVDNIARLGKRNFDENTMPGVNRSMVGAGQFGSTRNAAMLADAARDASQDITGQQAAALEQGYGTSAGIYGSDAAREQALRATQAQTALTAGSTYGTLSAEDAARQQEQERMRANTALTGGQLESSTGLAAGQQYGALGAATSGLGLADAQALAASGQQQQGLNQHTLDTAYGNAQNANNFDWNILGNMNSIMHGMQLPTSVTGSQNTTADATKQPFGLSPLNQLGGTYFGTQRTG